jgi:hypothetical protein
MTRRVLSVLALVALLAGSALAVSSPPAAAASPTAANGNLLSALLHLLLGGHGHGAREVRYVGSDSDWFNPGNWSSRRVPGPGDDVLIDRDHHVVIDPARGSQVEISGLHLAGSASLETLPGTVFRSQHELVDDHATLIHRHTDASTGTLRFDGCRVCGIIINPRPKSIRTINLQSSVTVDMGLGGTELANSASTGAGTYASIQADTMRLAGRLVTTLLYGFVPSAGQEFHIMTGRDARGTFDGLPEGAVVSRYGDVELRITYTGGDGNDVVLNAVRATP